MATRFEHWIGGRSVRPDGGEYLDSMNPVTAPAVGCSRPRYERRCRRCRHHCSCGLRNVAQDNPLDPQRAAVAPRRPHRPVNRRTGAARGARHRQGRPRDACADAGPCPLVPLLRGTGAPPRWTGHPSRSFVDAQLHAARAVRCDRSHRPVQLARAAGEHVDRSRSGGRQHGRGQAIRESRRRRSFASPNCSTRPAFRPVSSMSSPGSDMRWVTPSCVIPASPRSCSPAASTLGGG